MSLENNNAKRIAVIEKSLEKLGRIKLSAEKKRPRKPAKPRKPSR